MKIFFGVFFGVLVVLDLLMISHPVVFHRFTLRWFEWNNRLTRRLFGWEWRMVNEAHHIRFIRIYAVGFGLILITLFIAIATFT